MSDPMTTEELEAFRESAPERVGGPLWSLLDWSFWGAGMADILREPLADVMLAAIPAKVREHAEAIMADFIARRGIEKTGVTVYQEQRAEVERLQGFTRRATDRVNELGQLRDAVSSQGDTARAERLSFAMQEIRNLFQPAPDEAVTG